MEVDTAAPSSAAPSSGAPAEVEGLGRREVWILLVTVLIIATNGIIYELLIAGYSSYLLGDSIYQFSLTIGLYLSAMGVGSYLTRRVLRRLVETFIGVEVVIALVGGASVLLLSLAYYVTRNYEIAMFSITIVIGLCIGVEIPLVTRIIAGYGPLRKVIANVLSYDYIGALVGSLAFPMVLLPHLGFLHTALAVGLLNLVVALVNLAVFRKRVRARRWLWAFSVVTAALLVAGLLWGERLRAHTEARRFEAKVVLAKQSAYQRIVLTEFQGFYRLYLNGFPQFSTRDEHRYHEAMVHPPMSMSPSRERVLIMGGGDGLALREIWKYPDVKEVHMVDLDPAMTELSRNNPLFRKWNRDSMRDPRLKVFNEDAWKFLEHSRDLYPVIIVDLPDPTNIALSKLYSVEFYQMLFRHLAAGGMVSVQTSEISSMRKRYYWCVARSIRAAGFAIKPYTTFLPSFGLYVWTLASNRPIDPKTARVTVPTTYLNAAVLPGMFQWDPDLKEVPVEVNRIDSHALLRYFFEF